MSNTPPRGHTVRIGGNAMGPLVVGDRSTISLSLPAEEANPPAPDRRPHYHPILATDIAQSSGRGDHASSIIRRALRTALQESCALARIDWDACTIDDLGDGLRIAAPAGTPKSTMLTPLLDDLATRLHTHNRTARPGTRIRLRAALHAGEIHQDETGALNGRPLEVLARLLDAPPLRTALADAPESTTLAAALSEHFYEDIAPQGHAGPFHQTVFTTKEHTATTWLYLPGPPR